MNQVSVLNFQDFIGIDGEQLTTDSLKVAQVHRKRHSDVLRLIRQRMEESGDWGLRNFAHTLYTDPRAVAIAFGKRHKNVLQTIDKMLASDRAVIAEHGRLNFQPISFVDSMNRSRSGKQFGRR